MFDELSESVHSREPVRPPGLSEEQWLALKAPNKESAVICAGAGAGKTRLLVKRVARLLKAGVAPQKIVVVTFTRKAAGELLERLKTEVGARGVMPTCATVHALAYAHAKKHHHQFNLVEDETLLELVEEIQPALPAGYADLGPKELLLTISRARESRTPEPTEQLLAGAFEELMRLRQWDDFTSVLAKGLELPSSRATHVLVDEAQDLSELQLAFLRHYAPAAHFWFIGDPDQSIYGFRGAHASMMHQLRELCSGFYVLSHNYRCAQSIVHHAMNVIVNNSGRFDIKWTAVQSEPGEVRVLAFETALEELAAAQDWLLSAPPGTRAVLGRTQAVLAPLKAQGLGAYTVHESKGLEWDEVWVLGCEAGLLPHPMAPREEERRLFYVAMTRAKKALTMTYAYERGVSTNSLPLPRRHPSAFLFETQALQAKS